MFDSLSLIPACSSFTPILFLKVFEKTFQVGNDYWLKKWAAAYDHGVVDLDYYIGVYAVLGVVLIIITQITFLVMLWGAYKGKFSTKYRL